MTLYEFKALAIEQQYKIALLQGEHLGSYTADNTHYTLYQVDGFYVEDIYNVQMDERALRSFVSTNPLDPYLAHISIAGIFS